METKWVTVGKTQHAFKEVSSGNKSLCGKISAKDKLGRILLFDNIENEGNAKVWRCVQCQTLEKFYKEKEVSNGN